MTLSGKVWPVHFQPFPGEMFSSWFSRLAIHQLQIPSTFMLRTAPGRGDVWKQDVDVILPGDILDIIRIKCCQPRIERHTFQYWSPHFSPYEGESTALPRWICPAYIRRKTEHHYGVRFCPACLKDRPGHNLFFRLAFVSVCKIHGVILHDRCQVCLHPVSTHKIHKSMLSRFPKDALCFCYNCGYDYRLSSSERATDTDLEFARFLLSAIVLGHCRLGKLHFQYSHVFFQGLRLIAKGLLRKRLAKFVFECGGSNAKDILQGANPQCEIEFLPVIRLRALITLAYTLIKDWPSNFLEMNSRYQLSYSDWIRPRDVCPYWLSIVCKVHLRKANLSFK